MPDIDLRIQRLDQLFDNLDPAPFHAKALDRNAEAYLLESAGEYGTRQPLSMRPRRSANISRISLPPSTPISRLRIGRPSDVTGVDAASAALRCRRVSRRWRSRCCFAVGSKPSADRSAR